MTKAQPPEIGDILRQCPPAGPILIAGPTASGKSALALALAEASGGLVLNADAIQVYSDWRILTARPSEKDETRAPHALYGHVPGDHAYSVGQWLRDIGPFLQHERPIIVGGTGLYFTALTEGLAQIPEIPAQWREESAQFLAERGLAAMRDDLDTETAQKIDTANPMRVQRAWEVLKSTGKGLARWHAETPPPLLPLKACHAIVLDSPKEWLSPRIEHRFRTMIDGGALDEARSNQAAWRPDQPSAKAIGAAELMAHLDGEMSLDQVVARASILTRQFAKRQRTWFRARMKAWQQITLA